MKQEISLYQAANELQWNKFYYLKLLEGGSYDRVFLCKISTVISTLNAETSRHCCNNKTQVSNAMDIGAHLILLSYGLLKPGHREYKRVIAEIYVILCSTYSVERVV